MDRNSVATEDVLVLWRRCAEGSEERDWEALFGRLDPRLRRLVRGRLRRLGEDSPRLEDIDELVQEVYCRLLRHGRRALRHCRAGSPGELWRYLERLCASVVVDGHRSRRARKRGGGAPADTLDSAQPGTTLHDPEWCPEERLRRQRARQRVLDACRDLTRCPRLARRNRVIVESVIFEGCSIGEVALRFGLRKSGVSSVLLRLRRRVEELGRAAAGAGAVGAASGGGGPTLERSL